MAITKLTFGKLMEIWKAEEISLKQKLRLYSAAVISVVSFGFETWEMPQKLEDSLRGWNARCLAVITGREISQEHRHPTFDLVAKLRARRLKWAGQILRQEPSGCRQQQKVSTDGCRRIFEMYSRGAAGTGSRQEGLGSKGQTSRPSGPQHSNNTAAAMVASSLDASAEEWKKVAEIHNGLFTG